MHGNYMESKTVLWRQRERKLVVDLSELILEMV